MNTKTAYSLGVASGFKAARYGDFSQSELTDIDSFMEAASEILSNKRQYADSPTYDFAMQPNSETLFDAFDRGESVGLNKGWRKLAPDRRKAEAQQALSDALSGDFDGLRISDLSEIPSSYRGEVLDVNDHGNVTLYFKSARKLKEIASRV